MPEIQPSCCHKSLLGVPPSKDEIGNNMYRVCCREVHLLMTNLYEVEAGLFQQKFDVRDIL